VKNTFFNWSFSFPASKSCGTGWKLSLTVSSDSLAIFDSDSSFIKSLSTISFFFDLFLESSLPLSLESLRS
jgi:hypothetical protein